jgi:hypothetical protein
MQSEVEGDGTLRDELLLHFAVSCSVQMHPTKNEPAQTKAQALNNYSTKKIYILRDGSQIMRLLYSHSPEELGQVRDVLAAVLKT